MDSFKIQIEGEFNVLKEEIRRLQELNELKNNEINQLRLENNQFKRDYLDIKREYDALLQSLKTSQTS